MLAALMARRRVSKELWRQRQPLIPAFVPSAKGGVRKLAVSDEAALNGILFVLQTGILWEDLWAAAGFKDTLLRWKMKSEVAYGNETAVQPGIQG